MAELLIHREPVAFRESRYTEDYFTTNIYTDYQKTINDHFFKVMVGFNAELTRTDNLYGQGDKIISPEVPTINQTTSEQKVGGGKAENSVAGFFRSYQLQLQRSLHG